MSEQNKEISRRVFDVFNNAADLSALDEVVAGDVVDHNPMPDQKPGLEGMKQLISGMRAAFPNMSVTVDDIIADGDRVVARWTGTGTHNGEFMGIPATGNNVTVTGIGIDRIDGGKIVEHWEQFDAMGMMQQLGAIPSQ